VRNGRASIIGKQPTPLHWFAADDLARMVTVAYEKEEAANKRFIIHGPEGIPMIEALRRYCAQLHPEIEKVSPMLLWIARLMATVTRNETMRFRVAVFAYFDRIGELGDPMEANQLLGAPTTTLDAWIKQRKIKMTEVKTT